MPLINKKTPSFNDQFERLPDQIHKVSKTAFKRFRENPDFPSLSRHRLKDRKGAGHKPGSFAVSVTSRYRSIYIEVDGVCIWYWTGTHSEYNRFTKGGET